MYFEHVEEGDISKAGACREIGELLGVKESTLRNWIRKQNNRNKHPQPGSLSYEQLQAAYEEQAKEVAKLRRASDILKTASLGSIRQRSITSYCSAGVRNQRTLRGRVNLRRAHRARDHDCQGTLYAHKARGFGPTDAELDEAYAAHGIYRLWEANRKVYGRANSGSPPFVTA